MGVQPVRGLFLCALAQRYDELDSAAVPAAAGAPPAMRPPGPSEPGAWTAAVGLVCDGRAAAVHSRAGAFQAQTKRYGNCPDGDGRQAGLRAFFRRTGLTPGAWGGRIVVSTWSLARAASPHARAFFIGPPLMTGLCAY